MTSFVRLSLATVIALSALAPASSAQPAPDAPPAPTPDTPPSTAPPVEDPITTTTPATAAVPLPDAAASPPAAAPSPAAPGGPPAAGSTAWTSLRRLHEKGVISDAEYDAALRDLSGVTGGPDAAMLVTSKLQLTLFGFAQADVRYDSTQSCLDVCGALPIQKRRTYGGEHGRLIVSPRGSRLGVRVAAPKQHGVRISGLLEADFLGATAAGTTEQDLWSSPALRLRQAWIEVETPIVDVLVGQAANLFGWGAEYLVTSAQQPGLPGQMYQRTAQLRVSRAFHYRGFTADLAVAVERPPQQDSARPELVGGARLSLDRWTGHHTRHLTGSVLQPASIAVTVDHRRFAIAELAAAPQRTLRRTGGGVAVNVYLPILRATRASHDHALAISGEHVSGRGIGDMYSGLGAAGTVVPPLPPATPGGPPEPYTPNFDPGLAGFDQLGRADLIEWTSYLVGVEYYPGGVGGRLGVWANYGHMESPNTYRFGGPDAVVNDPVLGRTREKEDIVDGGAFFDPTRATRVGAGFAYFRDRYVDGSIARNYAITATALLFF